MHALAIFGIPGRMGQSIIHAVRESAVFAVSGAIASAHSARVGLDAASEGVPIGVPVTADPTVGIRGASVAVDFSVHTAVAAHAELCASAGIPILVGVTGFDADSRARLALAAQAIPVLIAPNTSVGVSVVGELVSLAARRLGPSYEVHIFDAHHRHKRDAPSGTALALGREVARARGVDFDTVASYDWMEKTGPSPPGTIRFSVQRAGDIVGEHTVSFSAAGERVEITHRAADRMTFARGALRAAEWLVGRPAGLYGMQDVLGP